RLGAAAIASSLQGGIINPDEKAPYEDELSVQLERQLSNVLAVRITGVQTNSRNEIRVANRLRPYEGYNIPVSNLDPGADNVLGTADDTGTTVTYYDYPAAYSGLAFQQPWYVNDSRANKRFRTLEFALTRRLTNRWQFQTSYTATKIHVPFVN